MLLYEFCKAIVADSRKLRRLIRPSENFDRREWERNDLHVIAELIQNPEARIDVNNGLDVRYALADVFAAVPGVDVVIKVFLRENMIKNIDLHFRLSSFVD